MGITIHFQGSIGPDRPITELVHELSDICRDMPWEYHVIDDHEQVKGIVIDIGQECEALPFLFDKTGALRSLLSLVAFENESYQQIVSVKTQFAPIDVHIAIVKLLKYIRNKYIPDLQVTDEGEYWDTGDRDRLQKRIALLAGLIDKVGDLLERNAHLLEGAESPEELGDKLEKLLRNNLDINDQQKS